MKLHDLKPTAGSVKDRVRVGRGIAAGKGKTAGRGTKGAGARGRHARKGAYFEGGQLPLVRRLPFKRGFKNIFRINYQEINLDDIAKRFEAGAVVSPETLVSVGLLRNADIPIVVLAQGELDKPVTIHTHRISKKAAEKVAAAGGTVEKLELKVVGALATVKKMRKEDLAKL